MFNSVKIAKFDHEKYFDLIVIILLVVLATVVVAMFKPALTVAIALFYLLPSLYLACRVRNKRILIKVLFVALTLGFFLGLASI